MKYETVTLLTPKIRFPMFMLFPMSFSPSSLVRERKKKRVYFCHSPPRHAPEWVGIFARNMNHADKTSIETF